MFQNKFNKYLKDARCSAKTISAMTDISEPTISRYRTGRTVPAVDSGNIEKIARALNELFGESQSKDEIFEDLLVAAYEDLEMVDYQTYFRKLSLLIHRLGISMRKLAGEIHISVSHLSRIVSGQAKPRNPVYIAEAVAAYVAANYSEESNQAVVKQLIWDDKAEAGTFPSNAEYYRLVRRWLLNGEDEKSTLVDNLLFKYAEFDKDKYLSYSYVDEFHVERQAVPIKDAYLFAGLYGLEEAVFTWLEDACRSKINEEVFIFDEIFLQLARNDYRIAIRWIDAIEKLIRSGKQITMIHNLERDLYVQTIEMLIVLPITMSKRIQHYFINESRKNKHRNLLFISSNEVLIGNSIGDDLRNGFYMQVNSVADIEFAKLRAERILDMAERSHVIFDSTSEYSEDVLRAFKEMDENDRAIVYLPLPPLATMDEDLLRRILNRNNASSSLTEHALELYRKDREVADLFSQNYKMDISLEFISADRWGKEPVYLTFNDEDINLTITYNREEYEQHIEMCKEYAAERENILVTVESMNFFKGMDIVIIPGKYASTMSLGRKSMSSSSTKKPIVDAIEELMYDISPRNVDSIRVNKERLKILQYYRNMVE